MAINLNLTRMCGDKIATREDATGIRDAVVAAWDAGENIQIDFGNRVIASVSFLDHAIGALALTHDVDEILYRVQWIHMAELDALLLQEILRLRSRQRKSSSMSIER